MRGMDAVRAVLGGMMADAVRTADCTSTHPDTGARCTLRRGHDHRLCKDAQGRRWEAS